MQVVYRKPPDRFLEGVYVSIASVNSDMHKKLCRKEVKNGFQIECNRWSRTDRVR